MSNPAKAQQVRPALEYEAERARRYYESGKWLMELIDEDSRAALWVLVEIYSRLLNKIAGRNYDVFTERVSLSTWEKLTVLARGFVTARGMSENLQQTNQWPSSAEDLAGLAAGVRWLIPDSKSQSLKGDRTSEDARHRYEHPGTGEVLDNCQHLLLGCCTNLIEFYKRLGVADKIRWFDEITFMEPGGRLEPLCAKEISARADAQHAFIHPRADAGDARQDRHCQRHVSDEPQATVGL